MDLRHQTRRLNGIDMGTRMRRVNGITLLQMVSVLGLLLTGFYAVLPVRAQTNETTVVTNPVPAFAYYYIWFDASSWNRAKIDYPLLGKYSSDDPNVMRQHIKWAKAAGLTGFLVSWKSTTSLNRRLGQLEQIAEEEDFKLGIIYEGLDFNRNPLPVSQIENDFDYFIQNFSSKPAFQYKSKPLVIWSGTWKFTPDQVSQVTSSRRNSLLILASERNVQGYQRLASLVDGDAYYWSSVNPDTFSGYQDKLSAMGAEVHKDGGLWIPPAAPGFDATQIGGKTNVDRKNGDTFLTQINTAEASSPDILGIISWNEFSENSYIEPSQKYGSQYLDILSQYNHLPLPNIPSFDSSVSNSSFSEVIPGSRIIALGGVILVIVAGIILIARRNSIASKNAGKK